MITREEVRIKAVNTYLKHGESLRRTSERLAIPHVTLWKWYQWYKEGGEGNLKRKKPYHRPWNRTSRELEEKIMHLKEHAPAMTLREAQEALAKEKIKISIKGIWGIWRRYALTGKSKHEPYAFFGPHTPESEAILKKTRTLIDSGDFKKAAEAVNSLPSMPKDRIISEIPEKHLTPRRQLDRLFFAEIPFSEYYKKANKIRRALEERQLFYSSIFAGFRECAALSYLVNPKKEIELINRLEHLTEGLRETIPRFYVALNKGRVYAELLQFNEANVCLKKCKQYIQSLPYPFFYQSIGSLFTKIGDYEQATQAFWKALSVATNVEFIRATLLLRLAATNMMSGNYKAGMKFLHDAEQEKGWSRSISLVLRSNYLFARGELSKASALLVEALEKSKGGQIRDLINAASFGLASIQAALGDRSKSKRILNKYMPLFRKYRMDYHLLIRNTISKRIEIDIEKCGFPSLKVLHLLQNCEKMGQYSKALSLAKKHGLLGFFHRVIVFFPDVISDLMAKGYNTGLPRAILNLPVFRKEIPVYYVNFLGPLIIQRYQKYITAKLTPKDTSFLIHLALSRDKSISLERVYRNFWPDSKHPARNLAHLLVRIRKALKLPSHFLYVKESRLICDCFFATDYGEYQEHVAEAKSLLRAGEWGFAKREYLQAFRLFRGEPFKKMYDDWSDDKRLEVLFSYEKEVLAFEKQLISRGRKGEAEKLHSKAKGIIS